MDATAHPVSTRLTLVSPPQPSPPRPSPPHPPPLPPPPGGRHPRGASQKRSMKLRCGCGPIRSIENRVLRSIHAPRISRRTQHDWCAARDRHCFQRSPCQKPIDCHRERRRDSALLPRSREGVRIRGGRGVARVIADSPRTRWQYRPETKQPGYDPERKTVGPSAT
jgi:hypothetical protein